MRTRLSVNDAISSSLVIAILAWCFVSLPIFDSYGLTNHIIYHSDLWWMVVNQRLVHLIVLFFVIYNFNKGKIVFWYDDENLYIDDRSLKEEQVVPLKSISSLVLQPVLLKVGRKKFLYEIKTTGSEEFCVEVSPGKKVAGFLKAVKIENPGVVTTDVTFN
ncbi:hypothetical protein KXQ82_13920 [Mucilaginibacter sp. HMF5004]|uniref:hypothetical protein n=1 Tax=Mucilaginibacter rivuli TaxID=2857527 RepID=UPI001C5E9532|nr:hypothetical protein [Mucilaginibacter rivuli]MBW4890824.1 hypothetical protein [Mucilaginibacter rivuli]